MAAAIRLCPQAVVLPPRMERYAEVSARVFEVLEQFTPLVEPLSIDEAFLDVSGSTRLFGEPRAIAAELKRRIRDATQLPASVGLAPNKFLAKLASDVQKPDGLVVVAPDAVAVFLAPLPIERLWGVGKATLPRFQALGVRTFGDALRLSVGDWRRQFGEELGEHFRRLVRGDDDRPVVPDREAKSISHETTFVVDLADAAALRRVLLDQVEQVAARLRRHGLTARTVTLKLRTPDFATHTRQVSLVSATDRTDVIGSAAVDLLDAWMRSRAENPARGATSAGLIVGPASGRSFSGGHSVTQNLERIRARKTGQRPIPRADALPDAPAIRLIGVGVSQLRPDEGRQLALFDAAEERRRRQLDRTVDDIRRRFGSDAIRRGE
jgi:DNA polymerase-4